MGKRKKKQNKGPAKKTFQSNSLVPARPPGEKPVMPFRIKTEESNPADFQPEDLAMNYNHVQEPHIDDIMFVRARESIDLNPENGNCSNSNCSTETVYNETNQGTGDTSQSPENQAMPTSYNVFFVKQEPTDPIILPINQTEGFRASKGSTVCSPMQQNKDELNNNTEFFLSNSPVASNSPCFKSEPIESGDASQVCDQNVSNGASFHIKPKPLENSENITESQSSSTEEKPEKRKRDYSEEITEISKRLRQSIKVEPADNSENLSVTSTGDQNVLQSNKSYEENSPTVHDEAKKTGEDVNADNREVIVVAEGKTKNEKKYSVITIEDDEDNENLEVNENLEINENLKVNEKSSIIPHGEDNNVGIIQISTKPPKEKNFSTAILRNFNAVAEVDRFDCKTALEYLSKFNRTNKLNELLPNIKRENRKTCEIKEGDILFKRSTPRNVSNGQISQPTVQPASTYVNSSVPTPPLSSISRTNTGESGRSYIFEQWQENLRLVSAMPAHVTNGCVAAPEHSRRPIQDPRFGNTMTGNANSDIITPNLSQQPVDPRFQKRFRVESESKTQASSTASAQHLVQFPHKVQSASNYVNLPASLSFQSSINRSFIVNASHSAPASTPVTQIRDPRLAHAKFAPRKGVEKLNLYHKIGRENVNKDFKTLMLQWNPSWRITQSKTGKWPPICDSYPTVTHSYTNKMSYYNTYMPLHLLNVWFTLFSCSQGTNVECTVTHIERKDNIIVYSCSSEMEDSQRGLKTDDIVWCKYNDEEAFLHVADVQMTQPKAGEKTKFKISLNTLHDLKLQSLDTIQLSILLNIRTALLQAEALRMLDPGLRYLVMKPNSNRDKIKIFVLQSEYTKEKRNELLKAAFKNDIRVILVENCYQPLNGTNEMIRLLMTHIIYKMVNDEEYKLSQGKQTKVLLLLKDDKMLVDMFRFLANSEPVLAIRTKQLKVPDTYSKWTLEDMVNSKKDIFSKHVFISTFSAFGIAEKLHLAKYDGGWNCIIYDARMCTELETAVPMTLKINKLFMIGNKNSSVALPLKFQEHKYNTTCFDRLLSAVRNSN